MLPTLSKILEKIVCEKYVVPIIEHQVNANQFAYVPGPGKGSVVALAMIYLRIYSVILIPSLVLLGLPLLTSQKLSIL